MRRLVRLAVAVITFGATIALVAPSGAAPRAVPLWVKHVRNFPGGISAGVRAQLTHGAIRAQRQFRHRVARGGSVAIAASPALHNVRMETNTVPPLPQNETSVAYDTDERLVAVAASNDYVSGGVTVMSTLDGGRHWRTVRVVPQFVPTRDFCTGGDPAVAYSQRDDAFYLTQLCFFRSLPYSEVVLFKSVDDGLTWTPGRFAAVVATNSNADGSQVRPVFHDKEYIEVDNWPSSPHFGRIYITWTKFHFLANGSSDFCPIQLAYTDHVPTQDPLDGTTFHYLKVVPDNPGGGGVGESADQFSVPQVQRNGSLDVAYTLEECNTTLDHGVRMAKITGGGTHVAFRAHVDVPGQYQDNPDASGDTLPPTVFRAPNTEAFDYNKKTGVLAIAYQNFTDYANSGDNLSIQFSRDGGRHWTPPRWLTVTSGQHPAPRDQFFPWIDSDENGQFHAIWFDRRRDSANTRIDTFQADWSGTPPTFHNYRISSVSWNPNYGFFGSGAFIGDYNGLAANRRAIYPVWTDGRRSTAARQAAGLGFTDIFTNVELHH